MVSEIARHLQLQMPSTNLAKIQVQSAAKGNLNTLVISQQLEVACWQVEHSLSARFTPALAETTERFKQEILSKITSARASRFRQVQIPSCLQLRQPLSDTQCSIPPASLAPQSLGQSPHVNRYLALCPLGTGPLHLRNHAVFVEVEANMFLQTSLASMMKLFHRRN